MKLPWDKEYLKISFHVIITLALIYTLKLVIDGIVLFLVSFRDVLNGAGIFFGKIFSVFSPLILAALIAYLLDPVVEFFQKRFDALIEGLRSEPSKPRRCISASKKRMAGVIITYTLIATLISVVVTLTIYRLGSVSAGHILNLISKTLNDFSEHLAGIEINLAEAGLLPYISGGIASFTKGLSVSMQKYFDGLLTGLAGVGGHMATVFIGLLLAFYFLRDKASIMKGIKGLMDKYIPRRANFAIQKTAKEIDFIIGKYIFGQLADACLMAVLISLWLVLIKLDFAVAIGIISGLLNVIPFFGGIVGFVLSVSVAFLMGEPLKALYACIGIIVLQQVDGMFFIPKIVGKSVRLHPAVILIAITIGGRLFGIWGMLLAVPVSAVVVMKSKV